MRVVPSPVGARSTVVSSGSSSRTGRGCQVLSARAGSSSRRLWLHSPAAAVRPPSRAMVRRKRSTAAAPLHRRRRPAEIGAGVLRGASPV